MVSDPTEALLGGFYQAWESTLIRLVSVKSVAENVQTYLPEDETVESNSHGPQVQCL